MKKETLALAAEESESEEQEAHGGDDENPTATRDTALGSNAPGRADAPWLLRRPRDRLVASAIAVEIANAFYKTIYAFFL